MARSARTSTTEDGASATGETVARLVGLIWAAPARLGGARLVCIEGPSASGKSTLAAALQTALPGSYVLETDHLLHGWTGLRQLPATLVEVIAPLGEGRTGRWRRWDWHADDWAHEPPHQIPDCEVLILEGVGTGTPLLDAWRSLLVWVEAPLDLRLARGLERDGEAMRPAWLRWQQEEAGLHRHDRTRERADVVVDGQTGASTILRRA